MNNFLRRKKLIKLQQNYGVSSSLLGIYSAKNNLSFRFGSKKKSTLFPSFIETNGFFFNRLLKIEKKRVIEEIKKQSSWRGLRFRQGLPVKGQRTHTNSSISKKLNTLL